MLPARSGIALKEWAVTVTALERGDQILLLRKGGIREDGRHFRIDHEGFFLYPTFYHEAAALLKPESRPLFDSAMREEDDGVVTLRLWAEVAGVIEITEAHSVEALDPFHIFTGDFASKRAHWKPRHPLNVLLLRCYKLQQPQALPVMPEYSGCKSWVDLIEEYPIGVASPVLTDREFGRKAAQIQEALSAATRTA
ncbi:MAG: DUF1802 family protein [Chloroflexi bacterium]|nr:DUF1802 family protein [Chloroflexota bacterium]